MLFGSADFVVVVAIKSNRTGEMVGINSLILDSFVIPLQEILSYKGVRIRIREGFVVTFNFRTDT
jgi:hypothetical protein